MATVILSVEELDDLIYYARGGDITALKSAVDHFSTSYSVPPHQIITAAIDQDDSDSTSNSHSGSGCCLLHWPAANGNEEVLNYLLSLLSPDRKQDASKEKLSDARGLLNHKNKRGNTPLHWAAVNGHLPCLKALMAAGADPMITNEAGHDALLEADCSGKEGGREVAKWMLANCEGGEKGVSGQGGDGLEAGSGEAEDEGEDETTGT